MEVKTATFAFALACGAAYITNSAVTDFAILTGVFAFATVLSIGLGVYTDTIAVGLSFGAFAFDAFAFEAVVLAGTLFDLFGEFKAATIVFDANLVLAREFSALGGALPFALFTLVGRAIWDALFVFASLILAAVFPAFALGPNSTTTFLNTFDTSGRAVFWQTASRLAWGALNTSVVDTRWLV